MNAVGDALFCRDRSLQSEPHKSAAVVLKLEWAQNLLGGL